VTVHRTSKDILAAQLEAWDVLIAELEQDEFNKRVMDSQRAWVEKVAYYELMNSPDLRARLRALLPGPAQALSPPCPRGPAPAPPGRPPGFPCTGGGSR
jgi:hypothetical protein